jgi:hypothetical protein
MKLPTATILSQPRGPGESGPQVSTRRDDGIEHAIEDAIAEDLTLAGFPAPLHLPMLAGLAQGAGFPNLSCLGLLSDRVLSRYVRDISAERDSRYHRTVSAHASSHPVGASPKVSSVSDASMTKGWMSW